jgi:hypothetical protein
LRPAYFSRLRSIPGPPLEGWLLGHFSSIVSGEPGIVAKRWQKEYGPIIRTVGPLGRERLLVFTPEALQRILVTEWQNYPRVRL